MWAECRRAAGRRGWRVCATPSLKSRLKAGPAGERPARRLPLTRALDSALGGGLADDALHEIAPAEPADGAAAMGFALALAARFLDQRPAAGLMIGEGFAEREAGALYGPGLVAHGLPLSRLVFVRAPDARAAFWAMEEALKCGAPAAVVGEIWNLNGYSLAASRRLLHRRAKRADAGAAGAGERLWPGGTPLQRRRDAVRDRRRAERAELRRRAARTCPAPSPAGRGWSKRGLRSRATGRLTLTTRRAFSVWNGEARTGLLATRRFLSLWLPRLATDRARRLDRR